MGARLHFPCNYKKLRYLTRNNKHIVHRNGLDSDVQEQIIRCSFFAGWLREVIQRVEQDDVLSLALHCYKGTHRSVAAAEILKAKYYPLATVHHLTLQYIRPGRPGGPSRR